MSEMFKAVKKAEPKPVEAAPFAPDGETLPSGQVRYKVLCDGGISPSGVFWSKTVPAGASTADYQAAQAERDAAIKRLQKLSGKAK